MQEQIGMRPGGIGSGDLSSTLPAPVVPDPLPTVLATISDVSTSSLAAYVNQNRRLPPSYSKEQACHELAEATDRLREAQAPATAEEITRALAAIAGMLGVAIPEPQGIALYCLALQDMPAPAFKLACREIIKTHRWPRLPFPVELIEAGAMHAAIVKAQYERVLRAHQFLLPPA